MRSFAGTLLVVALAVTPTLGQDGKETQTGPRIEIEPESHDFGKVGQNQELVKEFEIRNVGDADLVIGRISTTCGCTAALTSEKVVKPGKTTTLKVTFQTRRYKGPIQRSISVASNDPRRVRTVKVKAFVEESTGSSGQ